VSAAQRTIGIVSPGAMGSAVGHVAARGGARVVATLDGRSERTAGLARRAGIEILASLADVVAAADVVLSIAPPGQAEAIARDVEDAARATSSRPLLADLNAIAPATVRRLASTLDLVDGSISGPPPWNEGTTRIYLSGPRAEELAGFGFPGVELVVVGDEIGLASAVKMCTASVYKGTHAVLAHALLTAHANGVVGHVLDDLGDAWPQLVQRPGRGLARATAVSGRYVAEMREIAGTQEEAGLTPALFEAMAQVYETLSRHPLARVAPEDVGEPSLEETLEALS
jgi:3-hydroxyisobutyrate dehydrogenase-like beta-hydroxyacid dehydrogenase